MLYTASIIALVLLFVLLAYYYRARLSSMLAPLVPSRVKDYLSSHFPRLSFYRPLQTWDSQREQGLSSSLFDIESNLEAGDSRSGLDPQGAEEVRRIMAREGVSFDQARLIRHKLLLSRHGIDPSGMPTDPKAITHL
ncbi:hypothetical protein DACRYDRAFT_105856 [Dacryopinax primogenitus]|uniref:Uncharacterized protein n=1 Tax=Dacryopinax primogenitus (strain DJM 731) TaxID=1858805 RepID=M5GEZ7_DACPD|nr:uncharacterized protein DACRYDRAFT_105856 [Dacryopinax primogenitus]EJU03698.1 hypothetical protein DACRYDRAFT_105856 [Dacryopinax primogenitus]